MAVKKYILNVPGTLHTRIKIRATRMGITLGQFYLDAIKHYLKETTNERKEKVTT